MLKLISKILSYLRLSKTSKLSSVDSTNSDCYGFGVTISGDGQWLAVGACGVDVDQSTTAGKVYIYRRNGNSWTEVSTITEATKRFGFRLSFNEDGSKLVVGSHIENKFITTVDHAKVFTYTLVNGVSTKVNELEVKTKSSRNDYLAFPALSEDGLVMAVGGFSQTTTNTDNEGVIHIYDWNSSDNSWIYRTNIRELNPRPSSYLADNIAINKDGSVIALTGIIDEIGVIYIYDWNYNTSVYELRTTITNVEVSKGDNFGSGLDISADGDVLIVGAGLKDTSAGICAGKVYVYRWNTTTSTFEEIDTLIADDGIPFAIYGSDVSMTTNKDLLIVGAAGGKSSNGVESGAVYIYKQNL